MRSVKGTTIVHETAGDHPLAMATARLRGMATIRLHGTEIAHRHETVTDVRHRGMGIDIRRVAKMDGPPVIENRERESLARAATSDLRSRMDPGPECVVVRCPACRVHTE